MFFLIMHTFLDLVSIICAHWLPYLCTQIAQRFCKILDLEFGQVNIISPLVSQNISTHYQLYFTLCYIYFDVDIGYLVALGYNVQNAGLNFDFALHS